MNNNVGKLPDCWAEASLFDVCRPKQWPTISTKNLSETGYPVYGANGKIGFHTEYTHEEPTILVTCRGATCGTINVCAPKSWVNGNAMALDDLATEGIQFDYALHALKNRGFEDVTSGSAQPQITRAGLEPVTIPLAPLAEQRRIVAKIEALQERSRAAREALAEVKPLLEQFRQSILAAAFRGDLTADWRKQNPDVEPATELDVVESLVSKKKSEHAQGACSLRHVAPQEWPITKLGNIFTFIDYRGKNPKKSDAGRRLITAKNIRMGYVQDEPVEYVSEQTYAKWMTRGFPRKGDILFVTEGHTMGFVAVNKRDDAFALAQRTITLQAPEGIDSRCFLYFLMTSIVQRLIKLNATGSAAKGIKGAKLRDFPIPFPSYVEQQVIAHRIDDLFRFTRAIESELTYSETTLTQLDQSILAKAFRGEMVPQDPNDEPASVLLERIRQQREAQAADQKKGKKKHRQRTNNRP